MMPPAASPDGSHPTEISAAFEVPFRVKSPRVARSAALWVNTSGKCFWTIKYELARCGVLACHPCLDILKRATESNRR